MTSIRKFLEITGTLDERRLKYFLEHEGSVPLCCFEIKNGLVKCDFFDEFLPLEEFTRKCLTCQKEIRKKLELLKLL